LHFELGVAMMINFSVKNFRSIKNEVILEFNASSDKDHPNFITDPERSRRLWLECFG
jgi:AAA15 family ATPase/GTPase